MKNVSTKSVAGPLVFLMAICIIGCNQEASENPTSNLEISETPTPPPEVFTETTPEVLVEKEASPIKVLSEEALPSVTPSSRPKSILELPDDISQPAVAWIEHGRPPILDSLSEQDYKRAITWLMEKQKTTKPNDVLIIYSDLAFHKSNKKKETVQVFQPSDFSGKAVRGGMNQALTDGRLTITVTEARKESYMSFGGPSPAFPFQYVVDYTRENSGTTDVEVDNFKNFFFEPSGKLGAAFVIHNLKREGNNYSDTDEPFVYEANSRSEASMSTRGDCESLNNICLHVLYTDGTETMFVVYIPPEDIIDKTI